MSGDGAWTGGAVGESAYCVLAPNAGPMTLDGTNTWLLSAPGSEQVVVVDPGPDDEAHLERVVRVAAERAGRVGLVVLTHQHLDHSAGAPGLAARTGAPVRALDPRRRLGEEGLTPGEVVAAAGVELEVVGTPGHTPDSLSFLLRAPDEPARVLTGDTVLGRGSTVIMYPEGSVGDYLDSLQRLLDLAEAGDDAVTTVLPGHGPVLDDPVSALEWYVRHRHQRLDQVRAALAAGARTATEVVARVYTDVDPAVLPAAEHSVRAQLAYLDALPDP